MANQFTHNGRPTLPGVDLVLQGIWECRHPGCTHWVRTAQDLVCHETQCEYASVTAPFLHAHNPMTDHRMYAAPSPLSSLASVTSETETDGENSPMIMHQAPVISRRSSSSTSVATVHGKRHRPPANVLRTNRHHRRGSSPLDEQIDVAERKQRKMSKEKNSRSAQRAVYCRQEDFLRYVIGWWRDEQSGGNGNGAGLTANKIHVVRAFERCAANSLFRDYLRHLDNGTLDQFKTETCLLAEEACNSKDDDDEPWKGTFLEAGEGSVSCRPAEKGKACAVHGHPDWRECRRSLVHSRWQRNEAHYLAERGHQQQQEQQQAADQSLPIHTRLTASARRPRKRGSAL